MANDVKRFVVDIQGREARECVFSADHDRIVSALTEAGVKMQAERDQWQREAIRLATAICTIGKMEFDHLTEDSKLSEVMLLIHSAIQERDALRAEVERLKEDQQRRDHENAKLLRDAWGEVDTLRAKVERLRKDAERYRWARRPESGNALFTLTGSGECGPNMDSAIDAAMEASR